MKIRSLIESSSSPELISKSINEGKWVSPAFLNTNTKYRAFDGRDSEVVTVISSKRDSAGEYDVKVKMANGKTEDWYISKDDKTFQEVE